MNEDFDKALFQATFNNFLGEIFQKQLQANKIEMDLVRKIEGKSGCLQSHLQIMKYCRKSIDYTDIMIKDVKDYFFDLKIEQLYNLFQTIFRILVYNIKKISQCYLKRFQTQRNEEQQIKQSTEKQMQQKNEKTEAEKLADQNYRRLKNRDHARKLEILDFQINSIQLKQAQIENQMYLLIADLKDQKQKIQKINSYTHHHIYEQIEKIFNDISHKSEYIYSNYLKNTFNEQMKNNILMPQDLQNQIIFPLKNGLKNLAKSKIQNIVKALTSTFQNKLERNISEIEKQMEMKKKLKKSTQHLFKSQKSNKVIYSKGKKGKETDQVSLQKQTMQKQNSQLQQKIKSLQKQIQSLKRQNKLLCFQAQEMKECIKREQTEKAKFAYQNKSLQALFKKRTFELQQSKAELQWTIQKNIRQSTISAFRKSELIQTMSKHSKSTKNNIKLQTQEKQTQTDQMYEKIYETPKVQPIFVQHKSFVSMRPKIRKGSSSNQQDKKKSKILQTEKNIKNILQKLNEFLFDRQKIEKGHLQEKQVLINLVKQQKYEQAIQKVKARLDRIYNQTNKQIQMEQLQKGLSKLKKRKMYKRNDKMQKSKFCVVEGVNIGTQTEQKKIPNKQKRELYSNFKNIKNQKQKGQSLMKAEKVKTNYDEKAVKQIKTDRMNPLSIQHSKNYMNSKTVRLSSQENFELIYKFKNTNESSYNRINGKENEGDQSRDRSKKATLENTFFQNLNFESSTGMKSSLIKRNLMQKIPNVWFKQTLQKIPAMAHTENKKEKKCQQQRQDGKMISSNPDEIQQQQVGVVQKLKTLKSKQIQSQDLITQSAKKVDFFKYNKEKSPQQYQQFLVNLLLQASEQLSFDKVTQIIEKYKSSCFTTRSASICEKETLCI